MIRILLLIILLLANIDAQFKPIIDCNIHDETSPALLYASSLNRTMDLKNNTEKYSLQFTGNYQFSQWKLMLQKFVTNSTKHTQIDNFDIVFFSVTKHINDQT